MRLALKLALGMVLAILPVIAVSSGLRVSREISAANSDLRADDALLARTVAGATAAVWRTAGESEARLLVAGAQQPGRTAIRWTWTDAHPGEPDAPTLPTPPLSSSSAVSIDHAGTRYTYVAVATPGGRRGAIEVAHSDLSEDLFAHATMRHAAAATVAVVAVCGCLALGLGVIFVGRPVRALVARMRAIGAGDLASRLHLPQRDELGFVAAEINAMSVRLGEARDNLAAATAAELAAVEQVRRADRLATVGKLAAGIAHELGTPLNIISGHAQLILCDHAEDTPAHAHATIVVTQTQRVAAIIRQLLDFARRGTPRRATVLLGPIIAETVALLRPLAEARRATLTVELPETPITSDVDAAQLQQAITNLVVNGLHALVGDRRTVVVRLAFADGTARIEVSDTGAGIASDVLPRIFEPFFTTKGVGEGTGLGLSVAYGIVRDHDGHLEVRSRLGAGAVFSIVLPATTNQETRDARADRC